MKDRIEELIEEKIAQELAAESVQHARVRWRTLNEKKPEELAKLTTSKAATLRLWALEFLAEQYGQEVG